MVQSQGFLRKSRIGRYPVIPILIILIFILMAIFADLIAPYPPNKVSLSENLLPPFWQAGGSTAHPLGTDHLGRDLLSRIISGSRVSLIVAFLAISVGGLVGTALGIISGYKGGFLDMLLMRAADSTLAFPIVLFAVLLAVTFGPSIQNVVVAVSITLWAQFARVIRGEVLSIRERDFVALAEVAGCSGRSIMLRHIFPNVLNTVVVMLTLQVGWVILLESTLSFLGAGVPPPTPAWGSMVASGRGYITTAWWLPTLPGVAILIVCVSFNLTGDWLREALDPKMRQTAHGG